MSYTPVDESELSSGGGSAGAVVLVLLALGALVVGLVLAAAKGAKNRAADFGPSSVEPATIDVRERPGSGGFFSALLGGDSPGRR